MVLWSLTSFISFALYFDSRHLLYSGAPPTTVFCEISVRRSRCCLEFSITWGRLKISSWPFHSGTIFETSLINSLRFSKVWFLHCTPQISRKSVLSIFRRKPSLGAPDYSCSNYNFSSDYFKQVLCYRQNDLRWRITYPTALKPIWTLCVI